MPGILEDVERKLSELRSINVDEMQHNLTVLREEKSKLEAEEKKLSAEKKDMTKQKRSLRDPGEIEAIDSGIKNIDEIKSRVFNQKRTYSEQILQDRKSLKDCEHYLPVMSFIVENMHERVDGRDEMLAVMSVLHASTSSGIGGREVLENFNEYLNSFLESGADDAQIITQQMQKLMIQHSDLWGGILRRIDSSTELLSNATQLNLERNIEEKFGQIENYRFEEKKEEAGKYFGGNAIFTYQPHDTSKAQQEVKFFVKGHQNFEMESNKRTNSTRDPKAPDIKEILVYKILEHIGFGPKSHYFVNPMARHGLFIATQDSGFTRAPEEKDKQFSTADEILGLSQKPSDADEVDLVALDIITRSLVLKDLHMKNYGRVDVTPKEGLEGIEKHKWKLFDFLVLGSNNSDEYDCSSRVGEDFLRITNHPDPRFTSSSGLAGSILRSEHLSSNRSEVVNNALNILEGNIKKGSGSPEMPFIDAVRTSYEEIQELIQREGINLGINPEEALNDMAKYCEAVEKNYTSLKEKALTIGQVPASATKLTDGKGEQQQVI